jgi:predicted transcriptional regulator of viral defense system
MLCEILVWLFNFGKFHFFLAEVTPLCKKSFCARKRTFQKTTAFRFKKPLFSEKQLPLYVKTLLMINATQIHDIFQQNKGIVSVQHLLEKGVSYYDINRFLADEVIMKLKRGVYKWATADTNEMIEVAHIVPKGIFCLQTACFYYELTTSIPSAYHIAIPDEQRIALPDFPPIKVYYWEKRSFELGATSIVVDNEQVKIYDLEKTICDTIRHRNKIGFDVLKEILKNYLNRKDRNLNRLNDYAKQLNIFNKVDDFIKLLL